MQKPYGMADLEHDVPNRADTIFEAGSVSKQFTAAAVLLLAQDGTLSLDDPVRKHVPELPDDGAPLTIRHMLHHTSGLRDWGEMAAIAGWALAPMLPAPLLFSIFHFPSTIRREAAAAVADASSPARSHTRT